MAAAAIDRLGRALRASVFWVVVVFGIAGDAAAASEPEPWRLVVDVAGAGGAVQGTRVDVIWRRGLDLAGPISTVAVDANGHAEIDLTPTVASWRPIERATTPIVLRAVAPGHRIAKRVVALPLSGGAVELRMNLRPGATLQGRVVGGDAAAPMAWAAVAALPADAPAEWLERAGATWLDGTFILAAEGSGPRRVVAAAPQHGTAATSVVLDGAATDVELQLVSTK